MKTVTINLDEYLELDKLQKEFDKYKQDAFSKIQSDYFENNERVYKDHISKLQKENQELKDICQSRFWNHRNTIRDLEESIKFSENQRKEQRGWWKYQRRDVCFQNLLSELKRNIFTYKESLK